MPVYYDENAGTLAIGSDDCESCGSPNYYDTGCAAPGCMGRYCTDCYAGCDIEARSFGRSRCEDALDAESDEEAAARVNAERAAFGLTPIQAADPEAAPRAAGTEE